MHRHGSAFFKHTKKKTSVSSDQSKDKVVVVQLGYVSFRLSLAQTLLKRASPSGVLDPGPGTGARFSCVGMATESCASFLARARSFRRDLAKSCVPGSTTFEVA